MRNGVTITPTKLKVLRTTGKAVPANFEGGSFGRGDSGAEWTFGAQMEIWW
ncbi:hypothetical protein ACLB1O_22125 [Escherichia coli]